MSFDVLHLNLDNLHLSWVIWHKDIWQFKKIIVEKIQFFTEVLFVATYFGGCGLDNLINWYFLLAAAVQRDWNVHGHDQARSLQRLALWRSNEERILEAAGETDRRRAVPGFQLQRKPVRAVPFRRFDARCSRKDHFWPVLHHHDRINNHARKKTTALVFCVF